MQLFKDYNKAARAHTASGGWLLIMDGGKQYGLTTQEEEVRALRDQAFLDQCEKYRCWDETKDPKAPRLLTRGLLDSNNEDQAPWLERCHDAVAFAMVGGIIVGYFDTKGEGEEWLVDAHAKAANEATEDEEDAALNRLADARKDEPRYPMSLDDDQTTAKPTE